MTILLKLNHRRLALALTILFLVYSIYTPTISSKNTDVLVDEVESVDRSTVAYSFHEPIIVTSDSDFISQGWSGLGSLESPFIIEGLNITTSITCILIANTTKHFVIRNCWFSASGLVWGDGVIKLENVTHARVENNVINGVHSAISVYDAADCSFTGNLIGTEILGLYAFNLKDTFFANNTQTLPNIRYPILVQGALGLIVRNNSFHSVENEGISLALGYDCVIEDNLFQSDGTPYLGQFGVVLRDSHGSTLSRNEITGFDTNLEILDGSGNIVHNNTITGSWRAMRLRTTSATIINNEIHAAFKGIELRISNSCVIESNDIQVSPNNSYGIESRVGNNTRIRWNEIYSVDIGILLQGGMNDKILENFVYNCRIGVSLQENQGVTYEDLRRRDFERYLWGAPTGATVSNNTFLDCGISFTISYPDGFNQVIEGNTINGGLLGYFYNWSDQTINGNDYNQIVLARCSDVIINGGNLRGVMLVFCTNSEIRNVTVSQTGYGIHVARSSGCLVSNSEIVNNDVGVLFDRSNSSYVYQSQIHNNGHGIFFDETLESLVFGCEIYQNNYAVVFIGAHKSIIESNIIHTNSEGIFLLRSDDVLVGNNEIVYNSGTGLLINRLSTGNRIIRNSFGWNANNAICTGTGNVWDDGVGLGNRWHNYYNTSTYEINEFGDIDRFPSLLGDGPQIPLPTENTNSTVKDLFTPTPLQATIAMGMISGLLVIAFANFMLRRLPN
ncbi:MAG: right-handed parallel beta-helix repeat-containing protein [Candidatus Thorarchaeota archaeon]